MRRLIEYIRSCFCKHDWELVFDCKYIENGEELPYQAVKTYRCKKCGYEKRYEARKK